MSTSEGSLTQKARELSERNAQFQQKLTQAALQVASNPKDALDRLKTSLAEAGPLQELEIELLQQMALTQQIPEVTRSWTDTRLQILVAQAQSCLLLARYEEAQQAIDAARSLIGGDVDHLVAATLDEIETMIIQVQE
jgi:hypothetical protein